MSNLDDFFDGLGPPRKRRGPVKGRKQPESIIQQAIRDMLHLKGWYTMNMHGNKYQSGVPDLYCCHPRLGVRWVEVKRKGKYRFTTDQLRVFPELTSHGVGIWVLTAGTEHEYKKLFKPANWWAFLDVMK
jgi:hypothetical protein